MTNTDCDFCMIFMNVNVYMVFVCTCLCVLNEGTWRELVMGKTMLSVSKIYYIY